MKFPLVASVVLALVARGAYAQGAAPAAPLEMKATGVAGQAKAVRTVKATAVVTAIDVASRSVTLKTPSGQTQTFTAGPEVKRLDEVAIGDTILVEYEEGLVLEFQSAGDKTVAPEAVVVGDRAAKDQPAGGAVAAGVRATVTVTAIDAANRMVVFQGPGGQFHQVKAGPKVKLERLKIGDRLLATYIQAVAITLEKASKK